MYDIRTVRVETVGEILERERFSTGAWRPRMDCTVETPGGLVADQQALGEAIQPALPVANARHHGAGEVPHSTRHVTWLVAGLRERRQRTPLGRHDPPHAADTSQRYCVSPRRGYSVAGGAKMDARIGARRAIHDALRAIGSRPLHVCDSYPSQFCIGFLRPRLSRLKNKTSILCKAPRRR